MTIEPSLLLSCCVASEFKHDIFVQMSVISSIHNHNFHMKFELIVVIAEHGFDFK